MTPLLEILSKHSKETTIILNALSIDAQINGFENLAPEYHKSCKPFSKSWDCVKDNYTVISQKIPAIKTISFNKDGVEYSKHEPTGKFHLTIYDHKH